MRDKTEIYWRGEGKYQKELIELQKKYSVNYGYTESPIMNMLLAVNKLCYDYYNNRGCNLNWSAYGADYEYMKELVDHIKKGLTTAGHSVIIDGIDLDMGSVKLFKELGKRGKESKDYYYNLEIVMDEVIKVAYDNIEPFTTYTIYFDSNNNLISRKLKLCNKITFGLKEEEENWYNSRVVGSTVVNTVKEKADAFEKELTKCRKELYANKVWKNKALRVIKATKETNKLLQEQQKTIDEL